MFHAPQTSGTIAAVDRVHLRNRARRKYAAVKLGTPGRNGSDFLRFSFHEFSEECANGIQH